MMTADLRSRSCVPCRGGVPALTRDQAAPLLAAVPNWSLSPDGRRLVRTWRLADFRAALLFGLEVARLADAEDHHPDLHLTEYRNLTLELWTHTVGGLTENDFILAAKIDALEG